MKMTEFLDKRKYAEGISDDVDHMDRELIAALGIETSSGTKKQLADILAMVRYGFICGTNEFQDEIDVDDSDTGEGHAA